ncbi:MAG: GIY-YIG nuclease family protein [bacterium]
MNSYLVYALYNKDHKKIYIGQSKDIDNRLDLHARKVFSNSYTARFSGDWVVIYSEQAKDRESALDREKQLKSYRGREFVKSHIPA